MSKSDNNGNGQDAQQQPMTHLISHFQKRSREDQSAGWDDLWTSDQSDLWDRGKTSPPLTEFLKDHTGVIPPKPDERPLKALVPGCGKGYEVILLAQHGFEAYGLEVSEKAVQVAKEHAATQPAVSLSSEDTLGSVDFVVGDFFKRDWEIRCGKPEGKGFDLIYDYTFLCALPPELRESWADRMTELLNPKGILVCLEFPLYKKLDWLGPPWGLTGVYWNLLAQGGNGILRDDSPVQDEAHQESERGAFKRTLYLKPRETYEVSKGTDMLSVWTLK